MKTTTATKYQLVSILVESGFKPAGDNDVSTLKRIYVGLSLAYAAITLAAIALLAMGRGTQVDAGYVFVTHPGDAVVSAHSTSVAQAFVPITASIMSIAYATMALVPRTDMADVARIGWNPIMAVASGVVYPFLVGQLALVARIADIEKVTALMVLALIGTIVDQVSLAMSGAGSQLERMPDMMAMAFFLRRAVYIAQVSGLASWLCVWVVLISNCSWQAANGTGVPTYTVPVVLVALGFFVADKAHLALMLAGRGCAVNSVTRRELMTSVGLLACIAIISFCGLV